MEGIDKIRLDKVFITHTMEPQNHFVVDEVIEYVKQNYDFENVYETTAGCTVSVHCGPNTLGILFIEKE